MSRLTVFAKIVAKKDAVDAVKRAALQIVAPTRAEEGCISYFLHQDNDNPCVFMFYENWTSEADLDKHMKTDHFKALVDAVSGITESISVNKFTLLDTK